jgi:hypothetical protein
VQGLLLRGVHEALHMPMEGFMKCRHQIGNHPPAELSCTCSHTLLGECAQSWLHAMCRVGKVSAIEQYCVVQFATPAAYHEPGTVPDNKRLVWIAFIENSAQVHSMLQQRIHTRVGVARTQQAVVARRCRTFTCRAAAAAEPSTSEREVWPGVYEGYA